MYISQTGRKRKVRRSVLLTQYRYQDGLQNAQTTGFHVVTVHWTKLKSLDLSRFSWHFMSDIFSSFISLSARLRLGKPWSHDGENTEIIVSNLTQKCRKLTSLCRCNIVTTSLFYLLSCLPLPSSYLICHLLTVYCFIMMAEQWAVLMPLK